MKKKTFYVAKTSLFLIIFMCLFYLISFVFQRKDYLAQLNTYFDLEKNTIDVFILGPSTSEIAISPMDLWHDYGIVSYNLSVAGQSIPINYYNLKEALKSQNPKLLIFDLCNYYITEETWERQKQPIRVHEFLNFIPSYSTKIEVVMNLVEWQDWAEYGIDIIYYHDRWKELKAHDFISYRNNQKGAITRWEIEPFDLPPYIISKQEKVSADNYKLSMEYLTKIIELCEENDIDILFTNLPSYLEDDELGWSRQRMWNGFEDFSKEQNYDYLNYNYLLSEVGIDHKTDYADWRHSNYSGQQKITKHLGRYIIDNYDIPDRRNDERYDEWNEEYQLYQDEIEKQVKLFYKNLEEIC